MAQLQVQTSTSIHPSIAGHLLEWERARYLLGPVEEIMTRYLFRFNKRETDADFANRRSLTPIPNHAVTLVDEVRDVLTSRLNDVIRNGGPKSYQSAIKTNVDGMGRNMSVFMGRKVIPDLLYMGRIGVWLDRAQIGQTPSVGAQNANLPYTYVFKAEEIKDYDFDSQGRCTMALLEEIKQVRDPVTRFYKGEERVRRHAVTTPEGVKVTWTTLNGKKAAPDQVLALDEVPFVLFDIGDGLLKHISLYQIALMNMRSANVSYDFRGNFAFYIEQYDAAADIAALQMKTLASQKLTDSSGKTVTEDTGQDTGALHGKRYPKGLEAPSFIHPSSEPLKASIELSRELKEEMRVILHQAVQNIEPRRVSAESKQEDRRSKEQGVGSIALELEYGENAISRLWAKYEDTKANPDKIRAFVTYPLNYEIRSEEERQAEAKRLREELPKVPSVTYQKVLARRIATINAGSLATSDELSKIHSEIDAATVIVCDPDIIKTDHEAGFVGTETASLARGYPKGEVEKAAKDHAERAARVALAQSEAGARGVSDLSSDPKGDAKAEKQQVQSKASTPERKTVDQGGKQ